MGDDRADKPTFTMRGDSLPPGASQPDSGGRSQARYGVDLSVTVDSEHNFFAGAATNLSAGGIFVATHIVHPVGTRFNLSIHFGDGGKPVRGVGEVRWIRAASADDTEPAGIGIQFLELSAQGEERIAEFLKMRQPLLVPR